MPGWPVVGLITVLITSHAHNFPMATDSDNEIPGLPVDGGSIQGVKYTVTSNSSAIVTTEISLDSDIDVDGRIELVVGNGSRKTKQFLGVYTVESAVEAIGFGPFQIMVTIFTGMIWVGSYTSHLRGECYIYYY